MDCSQCYALMPTDAPAGLCPRCALLLALETGTVGSNDTPSGQMAEPGFVVDSYRTVKLLGAGGMGAVYLAEQTEPIRRRVALKIIKPGLGSAEITHRFAAERQALAVMDHPNIAKVLDAGATADGRPYFVMEYVDGIPVTAYCDKHQLPARARLALFSDVCRAIHHAHQKGVIHRDVKPSNILVTEREGKAVPVVIDFGIAKAIDHRTAEETAFTQMGVLVGTPEYMSPEQAAASPDIDTSTDVYSLGVLLYELLTGVLPFDPQQLRRQGYLEILRSIREDESPRLTTRIREMGQTALRMAERRHTTLNGLVKQLRGDLEWITMRALEKDRTRRYASAAALAEDIERHLHDEPIAAGRPGSLYQLQKFMRRNRVFTASAAAVLGALAIGLALTYSQYRRAERQRTLAEASAQVAQQERNRAQGEARRADQNATQASLSQAAAEQSRDLAEREADANRRSLYSSEMNRASQAWRDANIPLLHRFLDGQLPQSGKPDLRGPEWFLLWRLSHNTVLSTKSGSYLSFSPDGQTVALTSQMNPDGYTQLWNYRQGRQVGKLADSYARDIAFSDDGKTLAVAEINEALGIYETASLKLVTKIPFTVAGAAFENSRSLVRFSPDRNTLAFIARGTPGNLDQIQRYSVKLWDLAANKEIATLPDSQGTRSIDLSHDGATLITTAAAGVRLWDVKAARLASTWPIVRPANSVRMARLSPDGTMVAASFEDGTTIVWDATSKRELLSIPYPAAVVDLAFSPDSKRIAMAAANRTIPIYELPSGRIMGTVRGFGQTAETVAFSADGRFLAAGSYEAASHIWDMSVVEAQRPISNAAIDTLAFSGDNKFLMAGGLQHASLLAQPGRKSTRAFPREEGQPIGSASSSADGSVVAFGTLAGEVRAYRQGEEDPIFGVPRRRVTQIPYRAVSVRVGPFVAVEPNGRRLVTPHANGTASVFDLWTAREVAVLGAPRDTFVAGQFSRDGSLLALVGWHGVLKESDQPVSHIAVLDSRTWKERFRVAFEEDVLNYIAISPDGSRVATFRLENFIQIRDMTGKVVQELRGALNSTKCLAYSPDGRRIIACDDREILFWDLGTGQMVASIQMDDRVTSAAFSPDGKTLVVGDARGRLLYLDARAPGAR